MSWEEESRSARDGRRNRLAELDSALELLEELNLRGEATVPPRLRIRLQAMGVPVGPRDSPTSLLEKVLVVQDVYLLHPVELDRVDSGRPPSGPVR
ncbi:MAG: hypothetical protein M0T72_05810 [Candidatus Dormibacteraeota bacterium]|nr:hypothetical protein [Candidatus Dormibacteraeota bacterium]